MKNSSSPYLRWLVPNFSAILAIAAIAGAVIVGPQMLNTDGDLGRHITIGNYILTTLRVPTADLFSHTMTGQPLTPHEWLAQVAFALVHRWMGLDGAVLLTALSIGATAWVVFRLARQLGGGLLPAVVSTGLAMAASSPHWLTRPHVFTFLLLALWLKVLIGLHSGQARRWWLLPLIMLVWANTHGAYIAGFVTWAVFGAGAAWDALWRRDRAGGESHPAFWRGYVLGGLVSLAVTLVNPSGPGLWGTSVGYLGNRYLVSHTVEYLPPNFHDSAFWPFLLMIALQVVLMGLQRGRMNASWVLLSGAWLVMGLYSARNVPLFAIVSAPFIARLWNMLACDTKQLGKVPAALYHYDQQLLRIDAAQHGLLWVGLAVALIGVAFRGGIRLDLEQAGNRFDPRVFPVQAVDWLAEHPQTGKVFNHFPWGGYLLYRQWPEQQVFIDGQTDFYGDRLTRQYEQVLTLAPGWREVLDAYGVEWVIVPAGGDLADALRSDAAWNVLYQDETAAIFHQSP